LESLLGSAGKVAAHLFHARPQLAMRELKRGCKKVQANRGMEQFPPLFPSLPAEKITITCNTTKTHKQPILNLF
jgi:hypothetical protein